MFIIATTLKPGFLINNVPVTGKTNIKLFSKKRKPFLKIKKQTNNQLNSIVINTTSGTYLPMFLQSK